MAMAKQLLNEAEQYLLGHWADARLLEETMEGVRTKYKEAIERVAEAVVEAHPELDAHVAYPTQFWGKGSFGFGRKTWPGGDSNWPSGLWLWHIRLELLTSEDSKPPDASIWISKKRDFDLERARTIVAEAAAKLLSTDELSRSEPSSSGQELFYFPSPSKRALLDAFSDDDSQRLVELLVPTFDLMARFVPVLDQVFRECSKAE
jgi:hypothetical protein